jgi:hypothetical protein
MRTEGVKAIVAKFAIVEEALNVHNFHPKVGILLFGPLDALVSHYELSFYNTEVSYHVSSYPMLLLYREYVHPS